MNDRNNKMLATISNSLNSHHIKSESKGAIELSKQVSLWDKIFQGNHKVALPAKRRSLEEILPGNSSTLKFVLNSLISPGLFIRQISRKQSHHWFENKEKRAHDWRKLVTPLRDKLHETLPNVAYPATAENVTRQNAETAADSTSSNDFNRLSAMRCETSCAKNCSV